MDSRSLIVYTLVFVMFAAGIGAAVSTIAALTLAALGQFTNAALAVALAATLAVIFTMLFGWFTEGAE